MYIYKLCTSTCRIFRIASAITQLVAIRALHFRTTADRTGAFFHFTFLDYMMLPARSDGPYTLSCHRPWTPFSALSTSGQIVSYNASISFNSSSVAACVLGKTRAACEHVVSRTRRCNSTPVESFILDHDHVLALAQPTARPQPCVVR